MDPVSIGLLASAAIKVLGPYLDEVAGKASDAFLSKASEGVAGSAYKAAGKLFELVKKKFSGNGEAEKSLELLVAAPSDPAAQTALENSLKTELERDPKFASALSDHLTQIANTDADVAFVNNIQGDVGKIAQFGTVYGDVTF
jgi:hypothetical protein